MSLLSLAESTATSSIGNVTFVSKLPTRKEVLNVSRETKSGVFYIGGYYVCNVIGKKSQYFILDTEAQLIESARQCYANITGELPDGYTYSRIARKLTEWLGIQQSPGSVAERLLQNFHYQKALPYKDVKDQYMCDLKSAYWQFVQRAESPILSLKSDGIVWHPIAISQRKRWESMLPKLANHKKLRLSFVGVNLAGKPVSSSEPQHGKKIFRGEYVGMVSPPGDLRPLASLCVRSTYEVTQLQSSFVDSIYANADCVISDTKDMDYWSMLKLNYSIKAQGDTTINYIGSYECGNYRTLNYQEGDSPTPKYPVNLDTSKDTLFHLHLTKY